MGFRTVVMLNNDFSDKWANDPKLGEKIQYAMNFANSSRPDRKREANIDSYGRVVECVHADTQTLVRLDHYTGFDPVSYTSRRYGPSTEQDMIDLLKSAADKLGYKLIKKPAKRGE